MLCGGIRMFSGMHMFGGMPPGDLVGAGNLQARAGVPERTLEAAEPESALRPETSVAAEGGRYIAEIVIYAIKNGQVRDSRLRGPSRRTRREALKDCLELRKVAPKGIPRVRQRSAELEDITWTELHLGGRQLEGAETASSSTGSLSRDPHDEKASGSAGVSRKYKGLVRGSASKLITGGSAQNASPTPCLLEVADVPDSDKAKVALQQLLKRFGPILEIRVQMDENDNLASVRFANARAADAAMAATKRGFLTLGDTAVRVRQPASSEAVWRKFPPCRRDSPLREEAPNRKKKLRPNERFATRLPGREDETPDESESFWEARHEADGGCRASAAPAAGSADAPEPAPETVLPPEPQRPAPSAVSPGASKEDLAVRAGEAEVARGMGSLLEQPFSQQRRALKVLRRHWHPDKNPESKEVCTRVFQFIQAHDAWLAHHGLV